MDEDGLEFGTKEQILSILRQVERLDTHAVSSQNEAPDRLAPQGDGEHAAHAGKTSGVPGKEGVKHGFGIAMRVKPVAECFELRPQLQMVVDFAVEYNDRVAIARGHWLIARSQVENLQSGRAQGAQPGGENPLLIWSAMGQGRGRRTNPIRIGSPAFLGKAGNAAQSGSTSAFVSKTIVITTLPRLMLGAQRIP